MEIFVTCPRCRRQEKIRIQGSNLVEYYLTGTTSLAVYHVDHMMLVTIDRYGVRSVDICDPPSGLVHSMNMIVGEYLLIRNPLFLSKPEAMFIDIDRKIIDARMIYNHMYAVSFARYIRRSLESILNSGELVNVFGIKYVVDNNDDIIVASPASEKSDIAMIKSWIKYLVENVHSVPVDLAMIQKLDIT